MPKLIDAEELLGKTALSKVKEIPLSNDTMARSVDMIAKDLEDQLVAKICSSPWYGIQFDESTDVQMEHNFCAFLRF